jgi:acyl-CoA hydrolase
LDHQKNNPALNKTDESATMQKQRDLTPRPVKDSASEMVELVLPNDANPLNALLGGRLMHWIDIAGALAAHRHSRSYVVTASTDHLDFLFPVRVGDLVIFKSSVNRAFNTSMEVGVKVFVESYFTGESHHVSSAYMTFVAVDRQGNKLTVPPVVPETSEQIRRYEDAGHRRELRGTEKQRKSQAASKG